MSNQYNYAGQSLVVDRITELKPSRELARSTQILRNVSQTLADKETGDEVQKVSKSARALGVKMYTDENPGVIVEAYVYDYAKEEELPSSSPAQCKIESPAGVIVVDCKHSGYNPIRITQAFGTGFVVVRPNNDKSVYYPCFLKMSPQTASMKWEEYHNTTEGNFIDVTDAWVIGTFSYDAEGKQRGVTIYDKAISLWDCQVSNIMKVMGETTYEDMTNLNKLAKAMGIENVFKKIAVLEAFINRLFSNDIQLTSLSEDNPGTVRSFGYTKGKGEKGFLIQADGYAEFYDAYMENAHVTGYFTTDEFRNNKSGMNNIDYVSELSGNYYDYYPIISELSYVARTGTVSRDDYYECIYDKSISLTVAGYEIESIRFYSFDAIRTMSKSWIGIDATNKRLIIEDTVSDATSPSRIPVQLSSLGYGDYIPTSMTTSYYFPGGSMNGYYSGQFAPACRFDSGTVEHYHRFISSDLPTPLALGSFDFRGKTDGVSAVEYYVDTSTTPQHNSIDASSSDAKVITRTESGIQISTKNGQILVSFSYGYMYPVSIKFNMVIDGAKEGIETKHIVPREGSTYSIGTSTRKYYEVYAENVYGAVFNA